MGSTFWQSTFNKQLILFIIFNVLACCLRLHTITLSGLLHTLSNQTSPLIFQIDFWADQLRNKSGMLVVNVYNIFYRNGTDQKAVNIFLTRRIRLLKLPEECTHNPLSINMSSFKEKSIFYLNYYKIRVILWPIRVLIRLVGF